MADSHLYPRIKWAYRRFKFNYLLPVLILVAYTLIGAAMFRSMEREKDKNARDVYRHNTEYAFNQVLDRMLEVHCNDVVLKVNKTSQIRHAKDALVWFMDYLNLTQVIQERSEESPWTWVGSMFYAGQLYTTIGYGLPFAKTGAGQFASVIYIFIGIPTFLMILKEEGKLMSRGLRKLYKRLHSAKQKLPETTPIRRMSVPVKAMYNLSLSGEGTPTKKTKMRLPSVEHTMIEVELEPDPEKENALNEQKVRQSSFPISLALSILGIWILFSAWFFSLWEAEWGLTTSMYFFFVSISTVGLGDIIASNPNMMIVYFILILVGLALLSMCINLIQVRIEEILDRLLMEHIQKIEKMAKIVANDDCYDETTTPFEIEAANDMLTKPLTTIAHQPETGLWAVSRLVKGMMAGLANDMIAERLGLDSEESDEEPMETEGDEEHHMAEQHSVASAKKETTHPFKIKNLRRIGMLSFLSPQVMKTLQTLQHYQDKTSPASDFKTMLFSQFISSDKVRKAVDEKARRMVSCSMQTDPVPIKVLAQQTSEVPFCRIETPISLTTTEADSPKKHANGSSDDADTISSFDADSMYSVAYYDLKFDYGTDTVPMGSPAPLRRKRFFSSAVSMGMDEDFDECLAFCEVPPKVHKAVSRTSTMGISLTVPSVEPQRRLERCPSCHLVSPKESPSKPVTNVLPDYRHSTHYDPQSLARLGELCGLMPNDFLPGSMEDSGCYSSGHDEENSSVILLDDQHPPPKAHPTSLPMERLAEETAVATERIASPEEPSDQ